MAFVVPRGSYKCYYNKKAAKKICWESKKGTYWTTGGSPQTRQSSFTQRLDHYIVPCASLGGLLGAAGVAHLDFFSLDVEGAELVVLKTIDWSRLSIHLVQVEQTRTSRKKNRAVRSLLRARGFVHVHSHWFTDSIADEYFLNATYLRRNLNHVSRVMSRVTKLTGMNRTEMKLKIANSLEKALKTRDHRPLSTRRSTVFE